MTKETQTEKTRQVKFRVGRGAISVFLPSQETGAPVEGFSFEEVLLAVDTKDLKRARENIKRLGYPIRAVFDGKLESPDISADLEIPVKVIQTFVPKNGDNRRRIAEELAHKGIFFVDPEVSF